MAGLNTLCLDYWRLWTHDEPLPVLLTAMQRLTACGDGWADSFPPKKQEVLPAAAGVCLELAGCLCNTSSFPLFMATVGFLLILVGERSNQC